MKIKTLFYKLNILMLGIILIAIKILPEFSTYIYIALILNIILIIFSIKNKIIHISFKIYPFKIILLSIIVVASSLGISYLTKNFIPSYINLSKSNPTYISNESQNFVKNIEQNIFISYLPQDSNSEMLFKNIMKKLNYINPKIKYRVLHQIIDDNDYFKLRKKYPSFVIGSLLLEGVSKAQVVPNFNNKNDIIRGLKFLSTQNMKICIYAPKSKSTISVFSRLMKTNAYKLKFIPPSAQACDITIVYDKIANNITKKDINELMKSKRILIFSTINHQKNIEKLLDFIKTKISVCKNNFTYAFRNDILAHKIGDFTIMDNKDSCIEYTNLSYKIFFKKIALISSNIIDNRLIEFGDNAKFILSLLTDDSQKKYKKSPPGAISPSGLRILLFILLMWFLIIF